MFSIKKALVLTFTVLFLGYGTLSYSMNISHKEKRAVANFSHDHPFLASFIPNFVAFRCIRPLKQQPIRRFGLFTASTLVGAGIAQFFGHNYLHKNGYSHHPKVIIPICSNSCVIRKDVGFNQKAFAFLNSTYSNIQKSWLNFRNS